MKLDIGNDVVRKSRAPFFFAANKRGFKICNLIVYIEVKAKKDIVLDFKLSPCSECRILSLGSFPGV